MLLVIIFGLVTILSAVGALRSLKQINVLGILFGGAAFFVFGWFTVMTIINSGYPTAH
ncbi:membrane protein [Bacillus glycinifermentans]|uniref:DUF2759 domain-containing protein n=1 Tax=Bacillus glycinifermentans TaxID=1664069 RepID=A0AAJ3YZ16_9BACI|nr:MULTISPECIES: DUF2759 domain-containing protein [Bacillus]ATH92379.1 DUF2759 domain-containing protein [Bacillus glycinifermentans]KKB74544.1 membrane protein [Bacillus sp. TH008]KMM63332.1 membrane protein [Bacillus glycinifermentans]MBU8788322.1 DUF2759 domain-containing protein [Bacillus glycinifermentans]MDU0072135.1 DUF2759 domain-containing protein [Bacillus sp. IG6]